jgi:pre-mRNA-splicing factor RBM22/SLT11
MRFKRTEICTTCAKIKNVCQTCVLDLQYGLPVQVRDAALGVKNAAPSSGTNREYYMQNIEEKLEDGDGGSSMVESAAGPSARAGQELLRKLARTDPNYKRNRTHLCSFYAKGNCTRGDECPFRHELPRDKEDPLAKQNIKDRFYGRNDPVARKIISKHQEEIGLTPPEDQEVVSVKTEVVLLVAKTDWLCYCRLLFS